MNSLAIQKNSRSIFWKGAFFYAAMSAIGYLTNGSQQKSKRLYTQKFKQAPWAPPSWAFGVAWNLINVFITRALFTLLNSEHKDKKDRALLALQAGIWAIFCTFGWVYFGKKSPMLAAAWTIADAGLATASIALAKKRGIAFAANYLPLLIWTYFASTLAGYQALNNNDPLLDVDHLL
jgi:tryptophan-rich sensory protein